MVLCSSCTKATTKRNLKHHHNIYTTTQTKNQADFVLILLYHHLVTQHKAMNSRQVRTRRHLSQVVVLPLEEEVKMRMTSSSHSHNTQENTHHRRSRRIEYPNNNNNNNPPGPAISPERGTVGAYPMRQSQPINYYSSSSQGGYYPPPQTIISPEHSLTPWTSSSNHETTSSVFQQQSPPAAQQQLSPQNLTPFPGHPVWSYTFYLGSLLVVWFLYLLLPRGFRTHYCGAHRKRYARRDANSSSHHNKAVLLPDYWLPANQTMSEAGGSSVANSNHHHRPQLYGDGNLGKSAYHTPHLSSNGLSSSTGRRTGSSQRSAAQFASGAAAASSSRTTRQRPTPPSPEHPALPKIPPNKIISETMARLQGRGIRLVAHGVHCDPKRVWIKLDEEIKAVTWQTEFPRRVPHPQSGQVSIVLMRGSVHRIALTNVLYIDVGKKTNALQRLAEIPDPSCLSLLTQNGSLDLQANSKLERDALVSCFSMILDEVHQNENWRELYEASPDPSLANSSVASRHPTPATTTSANAAGSAYKKYPNPSDLLVDV